MLSDADQLRPKPYSTTASICLEPIQCASQIDAFASRLDLETAGPRRPWGRVSPIYRERYLPKLRDDQTDRRSQSSVWKLDTMLADQSLKFWNEDAAYDFVEQRVWPDGPVCPHCGGMERIGRLNGKSTRIHTYKCYDCRKPFTVKVGTIFQRSKVPMHKWLQAIVLCRGGKQQINANQLSKVLGVTFKTAKTMIASIREGAQTYKAEDRRRRSVSVLDGNVPKGLELYDTQDIGP